MRRLPAALLAAALALTPAMGQAAGACPPGAEGAGWREPPAATDARARALDDFAFADGPDAPWTDAVLVARGRDILYERYAHGFAADRPHIAWSASKSVLHAVFGAAVQDGLVDPDAPVAARSPWIAAAGRAGLTYRQLLRMSSGIQFAESYEFNPLRSSVIAMLYTLGRGDMAAFAAAQPQEAPPGAAWRYKSGDSVLLARSLRDVVGAERYGDYPWTALFDPLGVTTAVWERDAAGTFVGSSYLYISARDFARIGLLYLQDGCWGGRRLLPEGWVADAGTLAPALADGGARQPLWRQLTGFAASYGAGWWLNRPVGEPRQPSVDGLPADALIASGHWGQRLVVIASQDLVLVRFGDDKLGQWSNAAFARLALAAFGRP